jgi:uncharacterized protein YjbJ (UPF0337 family)
MRPVLGNDPNGTRTRLPGRDRREAPRGEEDAMSQGAQDRTEGKWDETKGRVKEAVGDATDNDSMEREGEKDRMRGKGKQARGHVKDAAEDVKEAVKGAFDDD